MTMDDDRREMAARLRGLAGTPADIGIPEHSVIRALGISGGFYDDTCRSEDVLALADLIDRPKCEMTHEGEGFRCSACGAFHDMSGFDEFPWPRCPECGDEVRRRG